MSSFLGTSAGKGPQSWERGVKRGSVSSHTEKNERAEIAVDSNAQVDSITAAPRSRRGGKGKAKFSLGLEQLVHTTIFKLLLTRSTDTLVSFENKNFNRVAEKVRVRDEEGQKNVSE